ncbi:hypothetical protein OU415_02540 [Saccharopolyspora sp. WRP15-2]|uniref:Uncharacterized protein n=1 Tax=Saccharopolyspora oryzae TaxID=2997343 RepID=A0ABT4URE8_9PSEU|nr:hypothetical protein [Saccharopolyspora oryzae]MDA3624296.1 hypothetical protein [Saccharopolyspora oryzae]
MRTTKYILLTAAILVTGAYAASLVLLPGELPSSVRGFGLVAIALTWVGFMTVSIQQTVRDTINLRMERVNDEMQARMDSAKSEVVAEIVAQFQKVDLIRSVARELGKQQQQLHTQSDGGRKVAEGERTESSG